ncbi:MAG TPA: CusA/CzcA family heavy metal efflux RND transporter, partial [Pyrinomonadaceae bacterium]|nr:CusA/CzcA family heavy metal efflux RND transporter [Pyrinomonadaceae bacterium]
VLTSAPSLAPLEVERQITFPVEVAMSGLPGLKEIRSISRFGLSAVTVVFDDSVDTYFARQLVLERLSEARDQIPEGIGSPEMGPISTGLGEIYQYELKGAPGSGYDETSLRTIQDWSVRRQLLGVPGVVEVNSFGGKEKQYQVRLDPVKLQSYGLSLRDVLEAVGRNNANVGGAYIEHGSEQYLLRGIGLAEKPEDISNIVVKTGKEGVPVYVRDLGEVATGYTIRQGAVTADGEGEIVAGIAMMLKGENSRTVVESIKERVKQVQKTLPKGVELVPFYDRTELVDRTIHTVAKNLIEGAALVIIVLIILLGNWRGALLVATVIPLSMLFAAILMRVFNVSGNLMSLGSLDFGLIVDGAVIVVENAVRRRAEAQHEGRHEPPERTILDACLEVGRPVVFAVAIITIVYLPLLSLTGIEGKMFKPMALTVVFALVGALILSLTYVPAAMTYVLRGRVSETESFLIRYAKRWYGPALDFVMRYRRQSLAVVTTVVLASFALFPFLGAEFIPRLEEGSLAVQIQRLPSVSLTRSLDIAAASERVLRSFPEVTKVVSKTGRAEVATDPMGVDLSDVYVEMKPPSEWTSAHTREELVEKMSKA